MQKTLKLAVKTLKSFFQTKNRTEEMVDMYKIGKTYEEIGLEFKLTKQRVQQIIKKEIGQEALNNIKHKRSSLLAIKHEKAKDPMKEKEKALRRLVLNKKRWSFYSDSCLGCGTTEKPNVSRGYCQHCAFHLDDKFREGRIKSTHKWQKKNPDKVKILAKKTSKNYLNKQKADPILWAKYLEKIRESRNKRLQDPENRKAENRRNYEKSKELYKQKRIHEIEMQKINPEFVDPVLEKRRIRQRANSKRQYAKIKLKKYDRSTKVGY